MGASFWTSGLSCRVVRVALAIGVVIPAASIALPCPAAAEDLLIVARTHVRVGGKRAGEHYIVSGHLLDDLNQPISGEEVEVHLEAEGGSLLDADTTFTDASGRFEVPFLCPPGRYRVRVVYAGDSSRPFLLPTESREVVEAGLERPELAILGPSSVTATRNDVAYEVRSADALRVGLRITLSLRVGGKVVGLSSQRTDAHGVAAFAVPGEALGSGGPVTLVARSTSSATLEAAEARLEVSVKSPVHVSLDSDEAGDEVEKGKMLTLYGRLVEGLDGTAVDNARVSVSMSSPASPPAAVANGTTDDDGRFRIELDTSLLDLEEGTLSFTANYVPEVAWRASATSSKVVVKLLPPEPLPAVLYVVPLAIALGAIGASLIVGRRRKEEEDESVASAEPMEVTTGLVESREAVPRRESPVSWVGGTVVDAVTDQPIRAAAVELVDHRAAATALCSTERDGSFRTPELPAGPSSLRFRAAGYVSESVPVQIPHRGRLGRVRIALAPVKQRVLEAFRRAALEVIPNRSLLFVWTPAELSRHVRRRSRVAAEPLRTLGQLFNEIYFSSRIPDEIAATRAGRLADEVAVAAAKKDSERRELPEGAETKRASGS